MNRPELAHAQRMGEHPVRRLRRMLADLDHVIDAVTQVIRQTRVRLAGETPSAKTQGACMGLLMLKCAVDNQTVSTRPVEDPVEALAGIRAMIALVRSSH